MQCINLKNRCSLHTLYVLLLSIPAVGAAQNVADCDGAIVVCGDTDIDVPDSPGEVLDFNNPNNDLGCHLTGETSSVWIYFRFQDTMPPGSELLFTIAPYEGGTVDYDFALFEADSPCDNLGSPVRCSYSWAISNQTYQCGFCPQTGLGNGATQPSQGIFTNGFVAPMIVEPGQGFYLYVNEFYGNSGGMSISEGFNISFGGVAADYFDCQANPNCNLQVVSAGRDTAICSGDVPFPLNSSVTYATGFERYTWTGLNGEEIYLNDRNLPNPVALFPSGFSGQIAYEVEVTSDDCAHRDTIVLSISPSPPILVPTSSAFCSGDTLLLDAGPGFETYAWSDASTEQSITIDQAGTYSVTVTAPANGCTIIREIEVEEVETPVLNIVGDPNLCAGSTDTLFAPAGLAVYDWDGLSSDSFLVISAAGTYELTVANDLGCTASTSFDVAEVPAAEPDIIMPPGICPDGDATLATAQSWATYLWSDGSTGETLTVDSVGTYALTVTDDFGCPYVQQTDLPGLIAPQPEIVGDTTFCFGDSSLLAVTQPFADYLWSDGGQTSSINALDGGEYSLTVTDNNGCTGVDTFSVAELPELPIDVSLTDDAPLCTGDTVFLFVSQFYPSYEWSISGFTGPLAALTQGGTYSVTVTDELGCTGSADYTVNELSPPQPIIAGPAGLCPDEQGLLEVGPFDIIDWGGGNFDDNLPISSPGTYSVVVTDTLGCSGRDTFAVAAFENPLPQILGDTSLCESNSIELGLAETYSGYEWLDGSTGPVLTVSAGGLYSVTVTSQQGCQGEAQIAVTEFSNPMLGLPNALEYCEGGQVTITPGSTHTAYTWSDGSTDASLSVNAPGIYTLTVENEFGCTAMDSTEVLELPLPVGGLADELSFCEGESAIAAANPTYEGYFWSDGTEGPELEITVPGLYFLTITAANGCLNVDSVLATASPLPSPEILGGNTLCEGNSLLLEADADYASYTWQDGSNGPGLLITQGGNYALSVTDAQGCTGETALSVTEVGLPVLDLPSDLAFCESGSVVIDAGGDFSSYNWSTGETSAAIVISQPGTYTLSVLDENSCEASAEVAVSENPLPVIALQGDLVFCEGESTTLSVLDNGFELVGWSNGTQGLNSLIDEPGSYLVSVLDSNTCSAELAFDVVALPLPDLDIAGPSFVCEGGQATLDGGAGYVDYLWSVGSVDPSIVVDTAGAYSLSVTDAEGCIGVDTLFFEIIDYPALVLPDTVSFCEDEQTILSAAGDSGVDYLWSTGSTAPQITVGQAGDYSLTVTNAFGCATEGIAVAVEIPEPSPQVEGSLRLCPDAVTTISLTQTFEDYNWSTGEQTPSITVSESGFYQVTITNAEGCSSVGNIIINDAPGASAEISGVQPFCEGDSIYLAAGNHNSYLWSDSSTGPELAITESGLYAVTVSNQFGCTAVDSVEVSAYALPAPELPSRLAGCQGDIFEIQAPAGFEDYQWSTGATSLNISVQNSGVYTLSVTDANGCVGESSTQVLAQAPPSFQLTPAQNICRGSSTTVSVTGEWASINWTTGEQGNSIVVDEQGSYGVVVTDSLGCVSISLTSVFVFDVDSPSLQGDEGFCPGGQAVISAEPNYAFYEWSNGMTTPEITVTEAGVYTLTVRDTVGCRNDATWEVTSFETPQVVIEGNPFLCEGSSAPLSASGQAASLLWSTGDTSAQVVANAPGLYILEARSAENCVSIDSFELAIAPLPEPEPGPAENLDCDTRSLMLGTSNPQPNWSYQWQGPAISPVNANLPNPTIDQPGIYELQVQDSLTNCLSELVSLEVLDLSYTPEAALSLQDTLDCNTPTVTLNGAGSANGANVVYQWYGPDEVLIAGASSASYAAGQVGPYTFVVLDTTTGCFNTASLVVAGDFQIPTAIINPNVQPLTCADTFSVISAAAAAPYGPPILQWSEQQLGPIPGESGLSLSVSSPGFYFFTVTDPVNGCQARDSVRIVQDTVAPVALIQAPAQLDCVNETVLLDGGASSQSGPFQYAWQGPGGSLANSGLLQEANEPGLYQLAVTNTENGCVAIAEVLVETADNYFRDLETALQHPTCFGQTDGRIAVLSVVGGTPPYLYSLNDGPFVQQPNFTELGSGQYELLVQDVAGCEFRTSLLLNEGSLPQLFLGEDRVIKLGDQVLINAQTNLRQEEWQYIEWTPQDSLACDQCLNWMASPLETTRYQATIVDTAGCTATDDILIQVMRDRRVYIPNAFSPNGDGANDLFRIFAGPGVVQVNKFEVYTRWGEQVFKATEFPPNDPAYGWDGRFRGETLNIGVFVYYAEIEFIDGEVVLYKGEVNLVR